MMNRHIAVSVLALALACPLALPAQAQIFGPSDEEKAHEANQDAEISDLNRQSQQSLDRARALEDKVRSLTDSLSQATGANEDLRHQIDLMNAKIDRMQKDFAYRLCTLSAQQLGAGASDQGGLNCAAAGTPSAGNYNPAPQGGMRPGDSLPPIGNSDPGPRTYSGGYGGADSTIDASGPPATLHGRPPGNLGTLPADNYAPPPSPRGGRSGASQFDSAMNLLAKAQYDEASGAFQSYADANPDDRDLTPQALFWVGNIAYVRQDYAPAARKFAEVIKKYPKASRAPDAMLKLAQSFLAMGQKSEGCTTLGLLKTKYPDAPDGTLSAASTLKRTACPK